MQKRFFSTVGGLLTLGLVACQPLAAYALDKPIYIFHTNDIHCGVEENIGFAKIAAVKNDAKKITPHVALVDAGDAIQGAPIGKLTNGRAIVNIMNAVGYDFLIPGNHEFDYGMDVFLELNKHSKTGYYCANLMDLRTGKQVLPGYKLLTFDDTKVAFVGATTPSSSTSSTPKFFQDADGKWIYGFCDDESGKKLYKQLQANVDAARKDGAKYVFIVGHLGLNGAKKEWSGPEVAKHIKGIVGVIDGHTHESYNRFEMGKNSRVVSQTGTKLKNLGLIIINPDGSVEMNMDSKQNVRQKADAGVNKVVQAEKSKVAGILSNVIGKTAVNLCTDDPATGKRLVRTQESNLGDFVTDAYKIVTGAEISVTNGGGIRHDIKAGEITFNDVLEAFPFGNMLCTYKVSGQQLLDYLELGARKLPEENGGFVHISGGSYTIDTTIPSSVKLDTKGTFLGVDGTYRVKDVLINGKPLDLAKMYLVGGSSYVLKNGGDGATMFKGCEIVQDEMVSDFDCISEYITKNLNGVVGEEYANPYGQGRIKIIK